MHNRYHKGKKDLARWMIPPAALAVHLCAGMAYGFSVFWLPLADSLAIKNPVVCKNLNLLASLFTTQCDWRVSDLGWIYTFFFIFIGISAAFGGRWLEQVSPRKVAMTASILWSGGIAIASAGVFFHQLWIIWVGAGVIGGTGLGLAYISPLSMLLRWFPDRPGMATGFALMGFGGGAIISAPLADMLMNLFRSPSDQGVWQTLLVMAAMCFFCMSLGASGYRMPFQACQKDTGSSVSLHSFQIPACDDLYLRHVYGTGGFRLTTFIFFINSAAGLGIIGIASPMFQEIFGGTLVGSPELGLNELNPEQRSLTASAAAGFMGILFLFSITGRFFWPFFSDFLAPKGVCHILFSVAAALYATLPFLAQAGSLLPFVGIFCVIMFLYGGGIAIAPACLASIFGHRCISAIHGRLLIASIFSGFTGPTLVNYMREFSLHQAMSGARIYDPIMYMLVMLMLIGFFASLFLPSKGKRALAFRKETGPFSTNGCGPFLSSRERIETAGKHLAHKVCFAWLCVAIPFFWGVWISLQKAVVLLH